jgi:hypothetical protein
MKAKYARQIRSGIELARAPRQPRRILTDLGYKAFRRESSRRLAKLLRRLAALQVESEVSAIMWESAETILREGE